MMESQQLLEIIPSSSIKFEGTFKEVITKKLIIKNPLDKNVAFKIKTTTPKQYCVRPSIGFIPPQQTKEISIILQPLQYTITEKARHKFMIQSLIISEEESANIDHVWKNALPSNIMCTKLLSVLVQTPEAVIEPEKDQSKELCWSKSETVTATDSFELPVTNPINGASEVGDVSMLDSTDSQDDTERLTDENNKLKEQVLTLKQMVFDQTFKLESLQADSNFDKDRLAKNDLVSRTPTQNSQLGLPLIIYQLLAFFLGLIIGKFFL